jgi:arabinofuranan 3-O-arabinosyltransferase
LWWIGGLWAEGSYGINILNYTESITTVASTSTTSEVLRGLGYWYFYGSDHIQPWTMAAGPYETNAVVIAFSYFLPLSAVVSSVFIKWRYRGFFVALALLGIVLAVGAYPISSPTPIGWVMKWLGLHTTVGLAMRSTNRAMPIVLLAFSLLVAAAVHARAIRRRTSPRRLVAVIGLASAVAIQPLFAGSALASNLSSPSTLPTYVTRAASDLNRGPATSTVLGLPGVDFGNYRYGAYVDSLWPGILNRPFETNQVTPQGENASVDLIRALDGPFQDGFAQPQSVAPIARLFSARDLLLQMDIQYERFNSPAPAYMWSLFSPTPTGLTFIKGYGPIQKDYVSNGRYINEQMLNLPAHEKWPPSLAVFRVSNPRPLTRAESLRGAYLVAGSGAGLVNLANVGLLSHDHSIFYEGATSSTLLGSLTRAPITLILTDTNAKQHDTFGTLSSSTGYVEAVNEMPTNTSEEEHVLYAQSPTSTNQTVTVLRGIAAVGASSYGNPIANVPEHMPFFAVDGDPATSWQTAAFHQAVGEYISIRADQPHRVSTIHFVQSQNPTENRWITKISISLGGHVYHRTLSKKSWGLAGETLTIPPTTGTTLTITIEGTTPIFLPLKQQSAVGFSEIFAPGFGHATRSLLLPTSLLSRVGSSARVLPLVIDMSRIRVATTPPRAEPELTLDRLFTLPYSRSFTIRGTAELYPQITDALLNSLLGTQSSSSGDPIIATSASTRMVGSPLSASRFAFDARPDTAWQNAFQTGLGQSLSMTLAKPISESGAVITVINDGRHAVPTTITISSNGQYRVVTLPFSVRVGGSAGDLQSATVHFAPLSGTHFTFTMTSIQGDPIVDRITGGTNHAPLGIAEISLPGVAPMSTPLSINTPCLSSLLSIDGRPMAVRISGRLSDLRRGIPVEVSSCDGPLQLSPGTHHVTTSPGATAGIQIDDLVLASGTNPDANSSTVTDLHGKWTSRSSLDVNVSPAQAGRILVLGQSMSSGWAATLDGHSLGSPTLVDGASTGWILPSHLAHTSVVHVFWAPQKKIHALVLASGFSVVALLLVAAGRRRSSSEPLEGPIWRAERARNSSPHRLAIGAAITSGLLVAWWAPVVVAALLGVSAIRRNWNWFTGAAVTALGSTIILTMYASTRNFPQDISWPTHIHFADGLASWTLVFWICAVLFSPHARVREV